MNRALWLVGCCPFIGCAEDPILEAWHHPFEVTSFSTGTGSCDVEPVAAEPDAPYLFFAVALGAPDVATLYWCDGPKVCPITPWVTISPVQIDLTHAEGALAADVTLSDTTCNLFWDDLVADLSADTLTATIRRWYPTDTFIVENPSDCEDIVAEAVGVECDEVNTLTAVRATGF